MSEARASIRIRRESRFFDSAARFTVHLDGSVVGDLADGESVEYETVAGRHEVYVSSSHVDSDVVEVHCRPGEVATLECTTSVFGWRYLLLPYLLLRRGGAVSLWNSQGPTRYSARRSGFHWELLRPFLPSRNAVILNLLWGAAAAAVVLAAARLL